MASAFDHGEIVALLGCDVAEARAAADDIDDDAGELGAGTVGNTFLHEAETGAGGCGHDALAGWRLRRTPC